jgi:hypothetical protein
MELVRHAAARRRRVPGLKNQGGSRREQVEHQGISGIESCFDILQ